MSNKIKVNGVTYKIFTVISRLNPIDRYVYFRIGLDVPVMEVSVPAHWWDDKTDKRWVFTGGNKFEKVTN